jgi:cytoplasmic iron level regulating protein YaaA (DUF328/UPF0246 family)
MILVVSPAKNLDIESSVPTSEFSQPRLLDEAKQLAKHCKKLSPADLSSLMSISDKLGLLNAERFNSFSTPFTLENARQAMFMFNGDVYTGLDAYSMTEDDIRFAQTHLCILSGLYGVLRPLDLMQAYRLEMGTKLETDAGKNLYAFWGNKIANMLNESLRDTGSDVLINLASNEYFKAVDKKSLNAKVVTPIFKDCKNGTYKIISFYAKKARGLMARYIIENKISDVKHITHFDTAGYYYDASTSSEDAPVFLRDEL